MIMDTNTPPAVLALCRELDIKQVALRFTDLMGHWHRMSIPISELQEDRFEDGFGLDGSGYPGWQLRDSTDLLLVPQPQTAFMDPFDEIPTLNLICAIQDPDTRDDYLLDPRAVAVKAVSYLASSGLADRALFSPAPEYYLFDDVQFRNDSQTAYYSMNSSGRSLAGGDRQVDSMFMNSEKLLANHERSSGDLNSAILATLLACGLPIRSQKASSSSGLQFGLSMGPDELLQVADRIMVLKYVIKKQSRLYGKQATFMPKPIRDDFGSGMHTYFSFWKGADPLFAGNAYAGLSEVGVGAIGGLLRHAPSLLALTNPSTNSYKRLVMQYDAPVFLAYSQRNRGTAVRVPMYSSSPKTKQIEFRCPDASSNPYLGLSAILMASLDGVQNKIHPGEPLDQNLRNIGMERRRELPQTPTSLASSLGALEIDHDFLIRGEVFSSELIESWIDCKRTMEIDMVRSCPHPKEFELYFDV